MHFEDIKALLRKRGTSAAGVARDLAVSKQTVSDVLRGTTVSQRVALAISQRVGVSVARLWPGKYPLLEAAARTARAQQTAPTDPVAAINAAIHQATATRAAKAPRAPRRA